MAYVIGAILAAGSGVRMGGPKAALVVDGQRLVDRAAGALSAAGCDRVIAVVGNGVDVDGAEVIVNPAPERGMRSSLALAIRSAARAIEPAERMVLDRDVGLAVMLVDTPGIDGPAVRAVVECWRRSPDRIAVGRFHGQSVGRRGESLGQRGHPTVMGLLRWYEALVLAGADEGARQYLNANGVLIDEVLVYGDPADLDRPEDLQAWRERHELLPE